MYDNSVTEKVILIFYTRKEIKLLNSETEVSIKPAYYPKHSTHMVRLMSACGYRIPCNVLKQRTIDYYIGIVICQVLLQLIDRQLSL